MDALRTKLQDVPPNVMALPPHLQRDPSAPPKRYTHSDPSNVPIDPSSLPTPIVPILTPYPRPLAQHLHARGFLARPITHPTVPKGEERVRVSSMSL